MDFHRLCRFIPVANYVFQRNAFIFLPRSMVTNNSTPFNLINSSITSIFSKLEYHSFSFLWLRSSAHRNPCCGFEPMLRSSVEPFRNFGSFLRACVNTGYSSLMSEIRQRDGVRCHALFYVIILLSCDKTSWTTMRDTSGKKPLMCLSPPLARISFVKFMRFGTKPLKNNKKDHN